MNVHITFFCCLGCNLDAPFLDIDSDQLWMHGWVSTNKYALTISEVASIPCTEVDKCRERVLSASFLILIPDILSDLSAAIWRRDSNSGGDELNALQHTVTHYL